MTDLLVGVVAQRADMPRTRDTRKRAVQAMRDSGAFDARRVFFMETTDGAALPGFRPEVVFHKYGVYATPRGETR